MKTGHENDRKQLRPRIDKANPRVPGEIREEAAVDGEASEKASV